MEILRFAQDDELSAIAHPAGFWLLAPGFFLPAFHSHGVFG